MRKFAVLLAVALGAALPAQPKPAKAATSGYPPVIEGTVSEVYRKVGPTELKVWIFSPPVKPSKPAAAIVFFFGGGWTGGSPTQFVPQSRALAERGMVAIVADYRVASRQQARPADCVADAKACVRWVRANAARLGIDPDRIVGAGGSAGGHLAAATATLPGLDAPEDNPKVSCVPNALVLFNPALVLAPMPGIDLRGFGTKLTAEQLGCAPEAISPAHHVRKGTPPTIIFHGKADTTVPYATAEKFAEVMKLAGNRCELVGYPGLAHGFFNKGDKQLETLAAADAFLVSLGYLPPRK